MQRYRQHPLVETLAIKLNQPEEKHLALSGLAGSFDAVVASAIFLDKPVLHVFIMQDKEEASYFANDLENLLETTKAHLFPQSYKKAYQYEEIENANVLQRAEVLGEISRLDQQNSGLLIVTHPEALCEKVINRKSLVSHTHTIRKGDKLDRDFLGEVMADYDFERTDFVYEPGQYAIRGFIVDVFSYSGEYPYRLELDGDVIESIRTFHPESQLSIEPLNAISIVPNVQTKLMTESRVSFFDFLPEHTIVWVKDLSQAKQIVEKSYDKVEESFGAIVESIGLKNPAYKPEELFDDEKTFLKTLKKKKLVEFGTRFSSKSLEPFQFGGKPQPSFNKDFNLLTNTLQDYAQQGFDNLICSDSPKQLERLHTVIEELGHDIYFQSMYLALRQGFEDPFSKTICYTDHQIFDRFHRYRQKEKFSKSKALTLRELKSLHPGDYVTHIDYGVGRFAGLEKIEVSGHQQEVIRLVYKDNDFLFVGIHSLHKISRYSGKEGGPPQISKLGSDEWENKKSKAKRKVKDIAKELISLYAKRKAAPGFTFNRDTYLQVELESSFIYEDTPDQAKATADVKADMEKQHPMDRLVCGDVGFGKTEVAIRAAFKAVADSKQVAVLVPTTILAMQHYKTFKERLMKLPCTVEYINRFKSTKEITETIKKVTEGKIDILIGTHRLVSNDVKFKNLGLLIIDEEQKFGVKTKDRLKELRINVDTLTLTATPIPRTLQFSLMGARDLSIIATPPPNRQPVTTEVKIFDQAFIRDAIRFELDRGGQVFFVHNRVLDIMEVANQILQLVPDAKIGVAHGQMEGSKLENVMLRFIEGEYDILVSTNIIESGLDIPNANTIIINRAHMFGLSDLHQMRGRVGRSNKKAYCYLVVSAQTALTSDARKRLQTLEEFSELGDGFKVAMRDLDIRGAGDMLGGEQSGFITDLGFDAYHKILDEAIQELKENEFKALFEHEINLKPATQDCTIETDLELLIPDTYVSNISERLGLYTQLDELKNEEELELFTKSIQDRFGALPKPVKELIKSVKLRWVAQQCGLEKLVLKESNLKAYFTTKPDSPFFQSDTFGHILAYVQRNPQTCQMRENGRKLILTIKGIKTVDAAAAVLGEAGGVG